MYNKNKVHHFYHIGALGNWYEPLSEHIYCLKKYGLLKKIDTLNFGIVGSKNDREDVKDYLCSSLDKFKIVSEEDSGWEQVTINALYDFALENDGYIFYAHTKASVNNDLFKVKHRKSMTYFTVVRWEDCIKKLNGGYTLAGSHYCKMNLLKDSYGNSALIPGETEFEYIKKYDGFYLGNFWWTTTDAIKTLKKCNNINRSYAEFWISEIGLKDKVAYDFNPYEIMDKNEDMFVDNW